jgi:hypothetical protein
MNYIGPIAVILGAVICLSSFIIGKKPEAKQLFEKVAPYQGFLGVGLLAWGLWELWDKIISGYRGLDKSVFGILMDSRMGNDSVAGISLIIYVIAAIIIGFVLGFGLIANWIPGEGKAEKKGLEIQKKLLGFSLPIGAVGLIFAILWLIKMPEGL